MMNTKQLAQLERMVRDAQNHPQVRPAIRRSLVLALQCLGLALDAAAGLADQMLCQKFSSLAKYEAQWYKALERLGALQRLPQLRAERAARIASTLVPYLGQAPASVLDVGCGDGLIAREVAEAGFTVSACDLIDWRTDANLEFQLSPNGHVPYQDRKFDKALLLMVAHHASQPDQLIQEVFGRGREIYIIESVTNNLMEFLYGLWFDWWYNNVLGRLKRGRIPVPCYFHTEPEWANYIYRLTGRYPHRVLELLVNEYLNPEHHVLFIYRT